MVMEHIMNCRQAKKCYIRGIALFLILLMVLPLGGCKTSMENSHQKNNLSTQQGAWIPFITEVVLPENFGVVRGLVRLGDKLAAAGSYQTIPRLYLMNLDGSEPVKLSYDDSSEDTEFVYSLAGESSEGFWVLSGELPMSYTVGDEYRTNDDFTGKYALTFYDKQGVQGKQLSLGDLGRYQLRGFCVDKEGRFVLWSSDCIFIADQRGALLHRLALSGKNVLDLVRYGDEVTVHISRQGVQSGSGYYTLNTVTGSLVNFVKNAETVIGFSPCYPADGPLLINDGISLLAADRETGETVPLFDWQEGEESGTNISCVLALGEREYLCASGSRLLYVTQIINTDTRVVLTLAVPYFGSNISNVVNDFNRKNEDYKIKLVSYSHEEFLRLNTEIIAGKGPDMMDLSYYTYNMTSGYFQDLLPYIDTDPELSREKFVPGLLDAQLTNGSLYELWPSFFLYTLTARTTDVGAESGWTVAEMRNLLESSGEERAPFEGWFTNSALLSWTLFAGLHDFVNWETGTCSFDSEEFIALLELCSAVESLEGPQDGEIDNSRSRENVLLILRQIGGVSSLSNIKKFYGNEEFTFIGFPTQNTNGAYFSPGGERLAILSYCEHKEAAWEFMRMFLLPKYQEELDGLSVLQFYLEQCVQDAVDDTEMSFDIADAEKLRNLINGTVVMQQDNSLRDIILEEADAFFAGDKTAAEAAAVIQNRATVYVGEIS